MLEFIVLGQIPGTNLKITLAWFVILLFAFIIWLDLKFHHTTEKNKTTNQKSL